MPGTTQFTIQNLTDLVEKWLITGEIEPAILAEDFKFISPFWRSNTKSEFIAKFQNSTIYQDTALSKITSYNPIIKMKSADEKHIAVILQYHTKNGNSVYETVLGTLFNGKIIELRSIYDLDETKKALQL
jgi:hypothetical protein